MSALLIALVAAVADEPPTTPLPPPPSNWRWVLVAIWYRVNAMGYSIRSLAMEYILEGISETVSRLVGAVSRWACQSLPDGVVTGDACAFD